MVVRILALAAFYAGVARLGLMLGAVSGFATLVWPPTGIAIAALLLLGRRTWPGIAIGAFVVNAWTGAPVPVALGIAAGNTLEAVLAVWLLRRVDFRSSLARVRDVLALVGFGALLAPTTSATIGVTSLAIGGQLQASFAETWRAWWLGDAMGALVVAPILLAAADALPRRSTFASRRIAEFAVVGFATAAIATLIFHPWVETLANVRQTYLVFPTLIWAALRFGVRGAAAAMFIMSAVAITGTALGGGAFGHGELSERLLSLQAFMAIVAVTVLVLGAVSSERDDAVRKREELLEVVSHELKNPLSSIQMSNEVILTRLPDDDRLQRRALAVQRSADRMATLIQSLLDLGAIEAGRLTVQTRDEDPAGMIEEAVEALRPLAVERSHTLDCRLPSAGARVRCDRERVLQVLANLVANAIKYASEPAAITISAVHEPQRVRFSVTDSGPGIPSDQIPYVFERYWQARPDGRRGSGLGLYICRGLVAAQHGEIWLESVVGKGTTFHFTLPTALRGAPK